MAGEEEKEDIEEEYLTCYICYDVFTEPKTLACLHRFCQRCLQGYLIGLAESARTKSFPCPVCRESNPAPDPRRPPADWASLLRTDFHLKNLIKALKAGAHTPGTRGGKVKVTHPCATHPDKMLTNKVPVQTPPSEWHNSWHNPPSFGNCQYDSWVCATEGLGEQHRKAEASIRQCSEAAVAAVRLQEKAQLQELQKTFTSLHNDVHKRLNLLDNTMAECQQVLETVQKKMKTASDTDIIQQAASLLHKKVLDVDEKKVHNILLRLENIRLEFQPTPNRSIKLGEIALSLVPKDNPAPKVPTSISSDRPKARSHFRPPVFPKRPRSKTMATMETPHVTQAPVKLRVIPGKFREDESNPKLRDVLVLSAQKMVLVTDWANQCVKAFHERRERDSRLGLGGKPWCLARVSDTAVAVSLPVSSQICVLKVTPRLALQSSFFAQKRYSGLAALNSDTLVASGGNDPPCVDIINLGGEVLRSFSHDVTTGRELFLYPAYIAMMPDKKHFLISDRRRAAMVCLSTAGQVRFMLEPDGSKALQEPSGVRTDKAGNIYLAEARGVVKVTPQGQLDRAILRSTHDGLQEPRGLDVDDEGSLYVISGEEEVVVYRMV